MANQNNTNLQAAIDQHLATVDQWIIRFNNQLNGQVLPLPGTPHFNYLVNNANSIMSHCILVNLWLAENSGQPVGAQRLFMEESVGLWHGVFSGLLQFVDPQAWLDATADEVEVLETLQQEPNLCVWLATRMNRLEALIYAYVRALSLNNVNANAP